MQALQLHLCERHSKHPAGHDFLKLGRQVVGTALSPTSGLSTCFHGDVNVWHCFEMFQSSE